MREPSGWSAGSFFTGNNDLNRLPQVKFANGQLNTTWGTNYWPWHNSYLNYQLRDDFSWTRGRHGLKFGFSYMRSDKNQQQQADTQGDYTFNGGTGVASQDPYINFLTRLCKQLPAVERSQDRPLAQQYLFRLCHGQLACYAAADTQSGDSL